MRVKFLFFIVLLQSCLSLNVANKKVASNSQSSQNEIQYVNSDETKEKGYPFSDATVVNGIIYLSGAIGTLPDGSVVSGGIVAETRQTMMNIKNRLEKMGGSMDDIFKCTCMLKDINDWPSMSKTYKSFFDGRIFFEIYFNFCNLSTG